MLMLGVPNMHHYIGPVSVFLRVESVEQSDGL